MKSKVIMGLAVFIGILCFWITDSALAVPVGPEIDATCTTDVTTQLRNFVASQPNGSVIDFPVNGCYRVEGTLEWTKSNITLNGNGSVIRATEVRDGHRAHVRLLGGSGWTINNLDVVGVNPSSGVFTSTYQWQHGFSFLGTQGATLVGSETRDTYGDGYYVGRHPSSGANATNIDIINGRSERPGRVGVAVVAGNDIYIQGGYFAMAGLNIFDMEPNQGNTIDGVDFNGVTVGPWPTRQWQLAITGPPGSQCPKKAIVRNITLRNSRFVGSPMTVRSDLIECKRNKTPLRVTNVNVLNNASDTVYSGPLAAVVAHHTDSLTATGNYQQFSGGQVFAYVCGSNNINVSGNQYPGASGQLSTSNRC